MSLSRVALGSLRLRSSNLFAKQLPMASMIPSQRHTATATPGKAMGAHALHFKLERYFAAAMVPLIPAAYFVHGPIIDMVLAGVLTLHIHWGIVAVVNDYARPIVVGPTIHKIAVPLAYIASILLLAGLLHFNTNDVGITKAFELIYAL